MVLFFYFFMTFSPIVFVAKKREKIYSTGKLQMQAKKDGGTKRRKKASSTTYIYELEVRILHFSFNVKFFKILLDLKKSEP